MVFILGHEVKFSKENVVISNTNIEVISEQIMAGLENGEILQNGDSFEWVIAGELSYLEKQLALLETKNNIVFEDGGRIYQIWSSISEDGYMYECYDMSDFISGDELASEDGGLCTGSARDAILMATQLDAI